MRVIREWLFRERALRGPCPIELDVIARQVAREEQAVDAATGEADEIEGRLQHLGDVVKAALTDAQSPGIIDSAESEAITRELTGTTIAAHRHTETLEAMA